MYISASACLGVCSTLCSCRAQSVPQDTEALAEHVPQSTRLLIVVDCGAPAAAAAAAGRRPAARGTGGPPPGAPPP